MKELKIMLQLLGWFAVMAYIAPVASLFGMIGMAMTLPWWVNAIYYISFIPFIAYTPRIMKWLTMENV